MYLSSLATFLLLFYFLGVNPLNFYSFLLFELLLIVDLTIPLSNATGATYINVLFYHIFLLYLGSNFGQFVETLHHIHRRFRRGFEENHVTIFFAEFFCILFRYAAFAVFVSQV
jgi:hypothetical protein